MNSSARIFPGLSHHCKSTYFQKYSQTPDSEYNRTVVRITVVQETGSYTVHFLDKVILFRNNITEAEIKFCCSNYRSYIYTYLHSHSVSLEEVRLIMVALKKLPFFTDWYKPGK